MSCRERFHRSTSSWINEGYGRERTASVRRHCAVLAVRRAHCADRLLARVLRAQRRAESAGVDTGGFQILDAAGQAIVSPFAIDEGHGLDGVGKHIADRILAGI